MTLPAMPPHVPARMSSSGFCHHFPSADAGTVGSGGGEARCAVVSGVHSSTPARRREIFRRQRQTPPAPSPRQPAHL